MIWTHRGKAIPLEVYHGIPKGWSARELLAEHARLGGTYDIGARKPPNLALHSWLPERKAWLQYRQTLYRIADRVRADDPACVELAIRYIELRYIGSCFSSSGPCLVEHKTCGSGAAPAAVASPFSRITSRRDPIGGIQGLLQAVAALHHRRTKERVTEGDREKGGAGSAVVVDDHLRHPLRPPSPLHRV